MADNGMGSRITFDYKDRAGPLIKPFDRDLLRFATIDYERGDCVIMAHELGKTLYRYYRDGEPNDQQLINRICKPWLFLKPVMGIAIRNSVPMVVSDDFTAWLDRYRSQWCRHWRLQGWRPEEERSVIKIGRVVDIDLLLDRFRKGQLPDRVTE